MKVAHSSSWLRERFYARLGVTAFYCSRFLLAESRANYSYVSAEYKADVVSGGGGGGYLIYIYTYIFRRRTFKEGSSVKYSRWTDLLLARDTRVLDIIYLDRRNCRPIRYSEIGSRRLHLTRVAVRRP